MKLPSGQAGARNRVTTVSKRGGLVRRENREWPLESFAFCYSPGLRYFTVRALRSACKLGEVEKFYSMVRYQCLPPKSGLTGESAW